MPTRERSRRVDALILRHQRWGEADRLLTIFTREYGKLRIVAKGARKTTSRKGGHLEPFMRTALQLAQGRDLWIVTQAEMINAFLPMRDDLQRMGFASYVIELLDKFTYEDGSNPQLYKLAVETLERLCTTDSVFVVLRYYEMRVLDIMGYRPQLFQCIGCQEEIKAEDQYFSALVGGVICPRCGHKYEDVRKISMGALKYLRHFQRSTYQEALAAAPGEGVVQEVEKIMQWYLTYLLERAINSQVFLQQIRKDG
ncbi:MAG: DNA repair protein RecO [Anaerolineaceae bacterium]|jgi:DNA repair protein RecO (recombination protein O)|nr:DNA repair protein RecO [Anaerolineaceae bacterium]